MKNQLNKTETKVVLLAICALLSDIMVIGQTITCPADITTCAPYGQSSVMVNPGFPTYSQCGPNAGPNAITRSDGLSLGDPYPAGTNTTITWTATNFAGPVCCFCNQSITVQYAPPLIAQCKNITATLDSSGSVIVNADDINAGPSACTTSLIDGALAKTYTCLNLGTNTAVLTVQDVAGNSGGSCTATVNVVDTTPPSPVCSNIIVVLDSTGSVTVSATAIDGGSKDNCNIVEWLIDGALSKTYTCADLGGRVARLTVRDEVGNTATCSAVVSVVALLQPTMTYSGNTNGVVGSKVTLKATLQTAANGLFFVGTTITFRLGLQTISAVTNNKGTASVTLLLNQPAGNYTVTADSGGICPYQSISLATPFIIKSSKK